MVQDTQTQKFVELLKNDHRFGVESYRLVNEALLYVNGQMAKEGDETGVDEEGGAPSGTPAHVTGQDLCHAVRDYSLKQYGLMAKHVLNGLGIRKTTDIGDIVYNLIEIGYMSKTENDSREDFDNVFDLAKELENGFKFLTKDQ